MHGININTSMEKGFRYVSTIYRELILVCIKSIHQHVYWTQVSTREATVSDEENSPYVTPVTISSNFILPIPGE